MITASEQFNSIMERSSRTFRAGFLLDGAEVSCDIKKIIINRGACGSETFAPGGVFSSYIEATVDELEESLENKELLLQIGLILDDGIVEYIDLGYYTVTKPKSTAYQTIFTAVGRITSRLNCLFETEDRSLSGILSSISSIAGVPIVLNDLTAAGTIERDMTGLTCKEALEVVASVLGGFATEDNTGNIVISKFSTENPLSLNGDRMTELPAFNDYDYQITGVKVIAAEAREDEDGNEMPEVVYSAGTPRLIIVNPYMTESLFGIFAENLMGYSYRPGTVPLALGDPRLDPWDCLSITDVKGDVFIVPCLSVVHTFDGGISTMITAPGDSETESETQTAGPIAKQIGRINADLFTAQQAIIKRLKADEADIDQLEANGVKINGTLTAINAAIYNLESVYGDFQVLTTNKFSAVDANIADLEAKKLNATDAELLYANIDFSNIGTAAMEYLYSESGLIENVKIGEATITGVLRGVTIVGDLIEGGTVKADKLVILGEDGLYYKLNTSGETVESEQTEYNSIDGSHIMAQTITASKIDVEDLVAFDATIGGFHITDGALYSGSKESAGNTTQGIYLDSEGQMSVGDGNNYIKYFKDVDGSYKLAITANEINFKSTNMIIGARNLLLSSADLDDRPCAIDSTIMTGTVEVVPGEAITIGFDIKGESPYSGNLIQINYHEAIDGFMYYCIIESVDDEGATSSAYYLVEHDIETDTYTQTGDIINPLEGMAIEGATVSTGEQVYGVEAVVSGAIVSSDWVVGDVTIDYTRKTKTVSIPDGIKFLSLTLCSEEGVVNTFRQIKIEHGNIPTDWSPAPEDADMDRLNQSIEDHYTSAISTSEEIVLNALEKYVQTEDYDAYINETAAELSIMADQISMGFESHKNYVWVRQETEAPINNDFDDNGRNLLLGSDVGYANSNSSVLGYRYFGLQKPIVGGLYTVTIKGDLGSDRSQFAVRVDDVNGKMTYLAVSSGYNTTHPDRIMQEVYDGVYMITSTYLSSWTDTTGTVYNMGDPARVAICQYPSSGTSASTIEWVKLEKWTEDGGNYLRVGDSNYIMTGSDYDKGASSVTTEFSTTSCEVITCATGKGNAYRTITDRFLKDFRTLVNEGDPVTFSIDVKVSNGTMNGLYASLSLRNSSMSSGFGMYNTSITLTDSDWVRISATSSSSSEINSEYTIALFLIGWSNSTVGTVLQWRNPKLEKGSVATPYVREWSAAPEDGTIVLEPDGSEAHTVTGDVVRSLEQAVYPNYLKAGDWNYIMTGSDYDSGIDFSNTECELITKTTGYRNVYRWVHNDNVTSYDAHKMWIDPEELFVVGESFDYHLSIDFKVTSGSFTSLSAFIMLYASSGAYHTVIGGSTNHGQNLSENSEWIKWTANDSVTIANTPARVLLGISWTDSTVGSTLQWRNPTLKKAPATDETETKYYCIKNSVLYECTREDDMEYKVGKLCKIIDFSQETAITISSNNSEITLELDNEKGILFKKHGEIFGSWDGDMFYTGNVHIRVDERAQFGNFAFIPRSDGSLMFLKVGD